MDDTAQILKLALAAQKKISETRIEDYEPYEFQLNYHNCKDKNGDYARQKFLQAGNQCLGAETNVYGKTALDRFNEQNPFGVMAWDGEKSVPAIAIDAIKKPRQKVYRVYMSDGSTFDCSGGHHILTTKGYISFDGVRTSLVEKNNDPYQIISVNGNKIVSYRFISVQDIYDFTVPKYHNYILNGLVHHNTGKTVCAASEVSMHATGDYPFYYEGHQLSNPTQIQVSGVTNETTRDICQAELFGDPEDPEAFGTGTIPKSKIVGSPARKSGIPNAYDSVKVRHKNGHTVTIKFRAYEAGPKKFMGHRNDVVWADEEPPPEIWSQMNRSQIARPESIILVTFTPENGTTQLVNQINDEIKDGQGLVIAAWEDSPHIAGISGRIELLLSKFSPHEREMRSKGLPLMGAGLVFAIEDDRILIDPIAIEPHWQRINGMDFGWDHPTGIGFLAYDPSNDVVYLVDEYCESKTLVPVIASAIKHRGEWIPTMWPHDGMSVGDKQTGKAFKTLYEDEGVNMHDSWATHTPAPGAKEGTGGNSVEAGLMEILNRMETGRFKVFRNCTKFIKEKGQYHRKIKNGQSIVVKFNDDIISGVRYGLMMLRHARNEVIFIPEIRRRVGPRMPHA